MLDDGCSKHGVYSTVTVLSGRGSGPGSSSEAPALQLRDVNTLTQLDLPLCGWILIYESSGKWRLLWQPLISRSDLSLAWPLGVCVCPVDDSDRSPVAIAPSLWQLFPGRGLIPSFLCRKKRAGSWPQVGAVAQRQEGRALRPAPLWTHLMLRAGMVVGLIFYAV